MKKIEINFLQLEHKNELKLKENELNKINYLLELSKAITSDELETLDVIKINDWLTAKTNFPSALQSAKLLELDAPYREFIAILSNLSNISDSYIANTFNMTKKGYILSPKFLKELTENYTIYLKEELLPVYDKLQNAIELLNDCELKKLRSSTALKRYHNGNWFINTHILNSGI